MDDKEIIKILQFLGDEIVGDMVALIELNGAIASGRLIDSIASKVTQNKEGVYQLNFSYLKYGKWVDEGRKPGKMPPVNDIKEWCRWKGIPQEAAWGIAKNIAKYGTIKREGYKGINFTNTIYDDVKVIKEIMGKEFSSIFTKQLLKTENLDLLKIKK